MRLAHISDLHFGSFSLNPLQFFSKRWIGNFNYLFTRKKWFAYNRLIELIDLLMEKEVTHVLITGDFTTTARAFEYKMGKRFTELLKEKGIEVFTVPGNHDHYTAHSYRKKSYYRHFPASFDKTCPLNLKDDCITYTKLGERLWLVAMDTAISTPMFSAQGLFGPTVEKNLKKALDAIPKEDTILLMNHYPLFHNTAGKHDLVHREKLESLLKKYPNITLYLHGHTHRRVVADLRQSDLPILSDCGSTPHIKGGACHLFEIGDNAIKLDVFQHDGEWKSKETQKFTR